MSTITVTTQAELDATFIAAARTDIPALVAALRAVLAQCDVAQRDFDRRQFGDAYGAAAPAILRVEDITAAITAALDGTS